MFSRYGQARATAAMLVCLSALILSAVSLSEICYARSPANPIPQTGDPDEFETRVSGGDPFSGIRAPMSADASRGDAERATRGDRPDEPMEVRDVLPFGDSALWRALRRFVSFVIVELDVM